MPFIDERRSAQNLVNIAPVDESDASGLLATYGAAFRTQNVVGSFIASRGAPDPYEIEDGFDAIDYVKDDPKFSPYVEEFAGIFNRKAADAKKQQIIREEQDRRTLDAAGASGVIAQMAAGVIDLPTLLPVGGAIVGAGGAAAVAGRAAIGAGIDAAVSESGLQATQATRTADETVMNIGGSVLLGGALGALVGRYLNPAGAAGLSRKIERQVAEFEAIDEAFAAAGGKSVGAAARDVGPLVLKDEALISKLPLVNRQDPLIRLQLGELDAGRQVVRQLAETPLEYVDNAKGAATEAGGSVETRVKMWNAPLAKSLREIDTHYARYYHGTPEPSDWQRRLSPALSEWDRFRGGQKLTYKQFKEEVGRAAYMGGQHEIPEVAAAAKVYREFDEQLKRAAIDARLFPEDVDVVGDISHRFRMYNRERIVAERGEFSDILYAYFRAQQEQAGFRAEEMTVANRVIELDKVQEQFDKAFARLDDLENRAEARRSVRGRKMEELRKARQTRFDVMKERAPEPLVRMLRGQDQNKAMIDAVREARAAARSANKKQSYADRFPVLSTIKAKGGVRVGSKLDQALRAMDVTPKSHPGLFHTKGGIGDIDNFVKSEHEIFADLADDGAGYVDPRGLVDAIRNELAGNPLRTAEQLEAARVADDIDRIASEWLESVGLPENATVKDVRDYIGRVLGAEKDLDALDARVSRLESEIENFDKATDHLINEREISAAEAATISEKLDALEKEMDEVRGITDSSPRVGIMVDYARTRRDLFKAKLTERTTRKRFEALKRLEREGRATDEMLAELAAKRIELERLDSRIGKLKAKADKLDGMAPKANDLAAAEEFANLSPAEVRSLVDETINTILGHAEGRIPYDIVAGPRGPLKERVLKIETAKIHKFVENDIEAVSRAQLRTMAPDIELSKKFGSVDLAEQIRKVNDEADAKIAKATTAKERQRLEKARKDAIRDVEGIRDRIRGTYKLPSDPSSLVLRAGRIARNLNYVRLLGGMTLSAIPDMGKIVFTHGLTSTFRDGFLPMIRNFKAFRLAAEEVKLSGTALDMVLDSRTMAIADIVDDFGRHSKVERGISALSSKYGVISLMAPWNAAMKQFTGLVTMTNIIKAAERVAKNAGTADDIRKLAAAGIDADLATRIAKQFAEHGDVQGGVYIAGGINWTDQGALEAFRAAVVRDVDRIIVTPGQDKPLWMSTELGRTISQFKSFSVSSMQKTALAGLQQRDAASLNGLLVMLGLGALAYYFKQSVAGREVSDNPRVWAAEAFDKSGVLGWLLDVNHIAEKASRGRVGLSAFTGEEISRYQSRNVYGAFLGPSADAVSDIFSVSGSIFAGDTTKSDLHKVRQLLPLQNLFYIRSMLNQVEEATGNVLGLPDRRK